MSLVKTLQMCVDLSLNQDLWLRKLGERLAGFVFFVVWKKAYAMSCDTGVFGIVAKLPRLERGLNGVFKNLYCLAGWGVGVCF